MAERAAVRAVLLGASGRMGRAIAAVAAETGQLEIVASIGAPRNDLATALRGGDVVLDFSRAAAAEVHLEACRKAKKPLLLGTTGHAPSIEQPLEVAAREIPLLIAPNTSIGIAVLLELVRRAGRTLPGEFDVEIYEAHHRDKRDAPSGTALAIGETIARARGTTLDACRARPRDGARVRKSGEIGFAVMRAGDIVGEHEVHFAAMGERPTVRHQATDRAVFARGAVRAAVWLAGQPPGRYGMGDVLSLQSKA
jgi:4-hydroxy-tetrahydrodipicolinate reductase